MAALRTLGIVALLALASLQACIQDIPAGLPIEVPSGVTPPILHWPDPEGRPRPPPIVGPAARITITPSSDTSSKICIDAGPIQLTATVVDSAGHALLEQPAVAWWSSAGVTLVDSTGLVSRNIPENGFSFTAIVASSGLLADTAWLMFSGLKWPNEPETTDGIACS